MRRFILIVLAVSVGSTAYSAVGKHNFTFNVGGSFNASALTTGLGALGDLGIHSELKASGFYGGGIGAEIGYLTLSQTAVIHALDLRLGVGANFTKGSQASVSIEHARVKDIKFNTFNASANAVYSIGSKFGKGRFLVDILGVGVGYFTGNEIFDEDDDEKITIKGGNNFLFSATLPLGMQYIFDNGFMIGFRHRIDIAVAANTMFDVTGSGDLVPEDDGGRFGFGKDQTSYFAYNLTLSLGVAIGK